MLCEDDDDVDDAGMMAVMLHDSDSNRWHTFSHISPLDEFSETMRAGDGGLVCIVSRAREKKQHPLRIVAFNPLTRQWRELPELPHALSSVQPSMVQLVTDRDSKCYKMIFVGPKKGRGGGVVASIYISETGQWSSAKAFADLILGYHYNWNYDYAADGDDESNFCYVESQGPSAYDCANGELLELDDESSPWKGPGERRYAILKDRLFVLHQESYRSVRGGFRVRYCISEYQAQKRQPHWVRLRVHRCNDFEDPPFRVVYHVHLYACNGFLLVTANNGEIWSRCFQHDLAWLYE